MSLTPKEQFQNFLEKSQEILLIISPHFSGDAYSAALGLQEVLENQGKQTDLIFSGEIDEKFSFLKKSKSLLKTITGARDFVLSFNTSQNKISNVRWEKENDHTNIYVTPEKGSIDPRDFSFILAKFKYDLIIVIGCPDLETLGEIYEKNTDLFFEVPVVNIDNKSENENFGKINVVDVTAASCSEIIYDLLSQETVEKINTSSAQNFLSGIISATDRFQKKSTTPKTFFIASQLMGKGADQQEIIRWFYKTQSLPLLKLWGRIMAKLNWNDEIKMAWSEISVRDFVESRANPKMLPAILHKLQDNYTEGDLFMIIYNDTPASSIAIVKGRKKELLQKLSQKVNKKIQDDLLEISLQTPNSREVSQIIIDSLKI